MPPRGLNDRQQKFVDAYTGNATEAARIAGYTGSEPTLAVTGHELLRNPKVSKAIANRQQKSATKIIATREDRQAFWTEVMSSGSEEMRDRLKASELLGRSGADFTDKVLHAGQLTLEQLVTASMEPEK